MVTARSSRESARNTSDDGQAQAADKDVKSHDPWGFSNSAPVPNKNTPAQIRSGAHL